MRQVWKRIEPDSYSGVVVEKAESEKETEALLESVKEDNFDILEDTDANDDFDFEDIL